MVVESATVPVSPAQESALRKFGIARSCLQNWPALFLDKAGLQKTITYRTRSGQQLLCRSRTTDVNEVVVVMSGLEYDPDFLRVANGSVVLDIGANIGTFAVLFDSVNHKTAYRGFAFEPFAANFAMLEENLRLNQLLRFKPVQVAVSNIDGTVRIDGDAPADAITVSAHGNTEVAASRLSTFATHNEIDRVELVKMDIEGSEYDVFESDMAFFEKCVERLVLEYHDRGPGKSRERVLELLSPGFDAFVAHGDAVGGIIYARNRHLQVGSA